MARISDAKDRLMTAVMDLICAGSYGSTTIDLICEKANVKKGSFYYFYDSKADLAVKALERAFQTDRLRFDAIFSPSFPPLERVRRFCQDAIVRQTELRRIHGRVLGCPLHSLGAEVSALEPELCAKIQEIMGYFQEYLEVTIRDAHAEGSIHAPDPMGKARMLFAYWEGVLTQARIKNDVHVLVEMEEGSMCLLGHIERAAAG